MWHYPYIKKAQLDRVHFGQDFSNCENFQCSFNPCYPLVALKYDSELWIILLPGKMRQVQGQIVYRKVWKARLGSTNYYDSCQWSPNGRHLLLMQNCACADPNTSYDGYNLDSIHVGIYTVRFVWNKKLCVVKELVKSWKDIFGCECPSQLSSKLLLHKNFYLYVNTENNLSVINLLTHFQIVYG